MGESMNVCSIYSNGAEVKHSHEIVGCVEYVRNNAIVGWVLSMSGATIDLHVQVNGEEFLCEVERFERPDIAEKYGNGARMCGFSLIPLDADCEVVEAMHEGAGCVEVVGNGVSLQWAFEEALLQDVDDDSKEVCTRSLLRSYLDSVNEFSIAGWGVRNDGSPCDRLSSRKDGQERCFEIAWFADKGRGLQGYPSWIYVGTKRCGWCMQGGSLRRWPAGY